MKFSERMLRLYAVTDRSWLGAHTLAGQVEAALRGWFTGERLGSPVLRAELTALLFGVEGVANCVVTLPAADVAANSVTLPQLGDLTVSAG